MAKNIYPIVWSACLDQNGSNRSTTDNHVGNQHDIMIAMTEGVHLNNTGHAAFKKGDYDTAIRNYLNAIEIKLRAYGEKSLHICITLSGLSDAYFKKGDILNAKMECERMLRIATTINNSEQVRIAKEILKDISDFLV